MPVRHLLVFDDVSRLVEQTTSAPKNCKRITEIKRREAHRVFALALVFREALRPEALGLICAGLPCAIALLPDTRTHPY
jgi:hypothetical protein